MKIESLHLERYGAFEGVSLDLSDPGIQLHVVYGPNEAGKTTVLSAITELLFGMHARTPYGFRHDYNRLRLGGVVSNAAGHRLAFKRKKGNAGTLRTLTEEEVPLPDDALIPFLGGAGRDRFTQMFGLSHARLREGGEEMLKVKGDPTQSLFQAGSGLSGIGPALAAIEAELGELGSLDRRASGKPLWREAAAFDEAWRSVRRDGLRPEEWAAAERQLTLFEEERRQASEELSALALRRARLERARRVAPLFVALDALAMRLEEIGEVSDLPEGFLDAWRGAEQARQNARLALQRAEDAHRDREADLEQSPAPGRILDLRGEIEALSEEIGRYRNGMADEPKLARDIQKSDADIGEHLRGLGLADDPAAGRAALPPTPVVAGVRELLGRAGRVEAAASSTSLALAKAREEHRETCEGHARHVEATDPESLNALLSQAAAVGDSGALLMKASSQAERAETGLAEALAQLPGWTASATALVATAFPVPDTVSRFEREIHARQQDLADARRDAAAARERLRDTDAKLAGLRAAGPVPSPAAIDAARDHRDRGWRVVRATYIDQEVPTPEDVEAFGAGDDLGDRFERAVRQADALADQRGTEAERVAQFVTLTQDRHVFADRAEMCMEAEASAEVELRLTEQAWRDLWAGTGVAPDEPAAMRAWLARRDGVVRALQETRLAQDAVLEAKAQAQRAREILLAAAADLGLDAADEMALPALDRAVRKAVSDAVQAWQSRRMSADRVAEGARRVKEAEGSAAAADAALAGWRADWAGAMSKLSLAETTRPAEAEAAIDAWEAIRRILINRDQAARRLEGLRRDNERFRSNLSELVFSLGEEGSGLDAGGDPQGSLKLLRERLEAAKALSTRRSQALAARDSSAEVLVKARAKDRAAADACEALRVSHGIAEGADVPRMVEIAAERRRTADEFANKRDEIVAACDGLSEVQVRAELAEVGPDEARAELDASQSTMDGLVARSQEATQRETEARLALKALAERDGVNTAAQRARNAAQATAEHLERWMRLTAAKSLLDRALELYRSENEHPLVKRGGEFFCAMAGTGENPIVRLKVDHGDESTPQLVGVRRDGADCPVSGMSEGTRDQLYLALRLAAVEQYALTHEPLPFIADDLFMTADDVRVEAGVRALAEIGRSTQVILFTHHRHVLLAAMRLPLGTVKEHRLAPIPHGMEVMAASGKLEQRIR